MAATKPETQDSLHHAMYSEIPDIDSQGFAVETDDLASISRCLLENN
ncbi:MAG: hypothetical protein VX350_06845 [Pseudomonadota bacterium]|nr:hypothetical protein [Pseudomonadota bacterium]